MDLEDRLGLQISSEVVEITKDEKGFVGVSIGGGYPFCPCVYIVQIFDGSQVEKDGRIKAGDEVVAINGTTVKGGRKADVAKMIQSSADPVKLTINHLIVQSEMGKTMDILLKKIKHKMVEFMEADTADALGLSRAILCNDPLVKKMDVLEGNANLYRTLVDSFTEILTFNEKIAELQKKFGDIFCEVGAHEKQNNASENLPQKTFAIIQAFTEFGNSHRLLEKRQKDAVKEMRPLVADLATYVDKAVPDTQLTVKKYLDVKYEYLSYCLKLKEMDDEEAEMTQLGEPLYRLETGNYEYRVMLRSRQDSRAKFLRMRKDVMIKIELLDQKHVRDMAMQLSRFAACMRSCQKDCAEFLVNSKIEPIEMDLSQVEARASTSRVMEEEEAEEALEVSPPEVPEADLLGMEDLLIQDAIESPPRPSTSKVILDEAAGPSKQAEPPTFDLIDIF